MNSLPTQLVEPNTVGRGSRSRDQARVDKHARRGEAAGTARIPWGSPGYSPCLSVCLVAKPVMAPTVQAKSTRSIFLTFSDSKSYRCFMSNPLVPRSARFPRIQFLTALMAAAFFLSHQSGMAATRAWNVASGDWNLNTNWSPATVPVAADLVRIDNGGLVNVTDSQVATTVESGVFAGFGPD